jgi:hypothetical protein
MFWKAFRNFQMQHRTKMLYCIKYIKLIVQLSRHFCGVGGRVLKKSTVMFCPHPLPLSRRCGKGMFADLISGAEPDADVDSPLGESV